MSPFVEHIFLLYLEICFVLPNKFSVRGTIPMLKRKPNP